MKLFYAGIETLLTSQKIELNKDYNCFLTYFYKNKTDRVLPLLKPQGHRGIITVDSGAHSFFNSVGVGVSLNDSLHAKKQKKHDPFEYFEKYFNWIEENYDLFDYFVELDIATVVGQEQVQKWRNRFKDAGLGKKMITVYHSQYSFNDYEKMIKESESNYIAIAGKALSEEILPYNKFLKLAYNEKVAAHIFGFTRMKNMVEYPAYSFDSTTYSNPQRFGWLLQWCPKTCKVKVLSNTRKSFTKHGISPELLNTNREKENTVKKILLCLEVYEHVQTYVSKLWKARGVDWERQLKHDPILGKPNPVFEH